MTPIIPLKEINRENLPLAGEKIFELSRLDAYDFRVPDGFCITSDVYARYMSPLISSIRKIDHCVRREHMLEAAGEMREKIGNIRLSPDTVAAVKTALRYFSKKGPFAARPGVFYDGTGEAAYTGIYRSFFNVTEENIHETIIKCWQDMFSEEAVLQKSRSGALNEEIHMAILIQEIVDSSCVGKLFTADPNNNDNSRFLIMAGHSGRHTSLFQDPYTEEYHVKKENFAIKSQDEEEAYMGRLINDEQIVKLAQIGLEVQDIFREAKSVEWVADKSGRIWLVQCESIKGWYPVKTEDMPEEQKNKKAGRQKEKIYLHLGGIFGAEDVKTEVGRSVLEEIIPLKLHFFGGRPYVQIQEYITKTGFFCGEILDLIDGLDCRTANDLGHAVKIYFNADKSEKKRWKTGQAAELKHEAKTRALYLKIKKHMKDISTDRCAFDMTSGVDLFLNEAEEKIFSKESIAERLEEARGILSCAFNGVIKRLLLNIMAGLDSMNRLKEMCEKQAIEQDMAVSTSYTAGKGVMGYGLTSLEAVFDLFITKADLCKASGLFDRGEEDNLFLYKKLDQASERIAEICGEKTADECAAFFQKFGFWGTRQMDITCGSWREEPGIIFEAIREVLEGAGNKEAEEKPAVEDGELEVIFGKKAKKLIGNTRYIASDAMTLSYFFARLFSMIKVLTDEAGEYLEKEKKLLYDNTDIAYLKIDEIIDAIKTGERVASKVMERKKEFKQNKKLTPPGLMMTDGVILCEQTEDDLKKSGAHQWKYLQGTGTAPGQAQGVARVIGEGGRIKLIPGEILVIPSMNMGYTPLMLQAGGVVSECGGGFCAGNLLCIERKIPAVAGVRGCTGVIRSGDIIRIDGRNGVVIKL